MNKIDKLIPSKKYLKKVLQKKYLTQKLVDPNLFSLTNQLHALYFWS